MSTTQTLQRTSREVIEDILDRALQGALRANIGEAHTEPLVKAIAVRGFNSGVQRRVLTPSKTGCINVHQVLPAPDPRYLLAVCEGYHVTSGALVVLDTLSGSTVSVTPVGVYPDFVGFLRTP